jgi:hypothetical protein
LPQNIAGCHHGTKMRSRSIGSTQSLASCLKSAGQFLKNQLALFLLFIIGIVKMHKFENIFLKCKTRKFLKNCYILQHFVIWRERKSKKKQSYAIASTLFNSLMLKGHEGGPMVTVDLIMDMYAIFFTSDLFLYI